MTAPHVTAKLPQLRKDYLLLAVPILALWTAAMTMNDDSMSNTRLAQWIPLLAAMALSMDIFAMRVGLRWSSQAAPHQYKSSPYRIAALGGISVAVIWAAMHLDSQVTPLYWLWIFAVGAYLTRKIMRKLIYFV
ncbi:MAG: hypothetical protein Q3962_03695 [Corynebacterium sp.]|nr:hypothetical protein [Corynebacterium sp.]